MSEKVQEKKEEAGIQWIMVLRYAFEAIINEVRQIDKHLTAQCDDLLPESIDEEISNEGQSNFSSINK